MGKKEESATIAIASFEPGKMTTNPQKFFEGFEIVNPIQLQEGTCFTLPFLGSGGQIEMQRASGDGVDYLGSWRFNWGQGIVRIMGSTVMDRELAVIEERYILPVMVKVWYEGKENLKGGHTLNMYKIGVDLAGKLRPQEPKKDKDGKELPF